MNSFVAFWKRLSLLTKLLVSMIVGVVLGIIFGADILVIQPLGTLFLNLLKLIALPLVICSLIAGISSVSDMKSVGRCGLKIITYYFSTTLFASAVGIFLAILVKPGVGFVLEEASSVPATQQKIPSILDTIVSMVPSNIFQSLTNGSFDHAVIFSILVSLGVLMLPSGKKEKVHNFFDLAAETLGAILRIVFAYAPIGVCALIACCVGKYGASFLTVAVKFLAVNYLSIFVMIAVYLILLLIFSGRRPLSTLRGAMPAMVTAFGTQSSAAVLPINLECAEKLGALKSVYGFTIPLGNQINKDGTAILLGCSFMFAAQATGVPVGIGTIIQVMLLSLLLTTGSTAVAGGAIIVITILIETFNLPTTTVVVVSGVLALIDGILTLGNTLGDLVGTLIVSDSEKKRMQAKSAS